MFYSFKIIIISLIILKVFIAVNNGMLVKTWGIGNQLNHLEVSIYDLFKQSFDILTAAQNNVYPFEDFTKIFNHEWKGINSSLEFHSYNGWLDSMTLESNTSAEYGKLRRFIMTRAEKKLYEKPYQHEMLMCAECIILKAKRFYSAYEAMFDKYETTGVLHGGPIYYPVSFQMAIISQFNTTLNQKECLTILEPLVMNLDPKSQLSTKIQNVGIFSFIVDFLDIWFEKHLNNTVQDYIKERLDVSIRKILHRQNVCDVFLSSVNP